MTAAERRRTRCPPVPAGLAAGRLPARRRCGSAV